MMRHSDAFKLAYTKLRIRKLRTIISLLAASLLFSVLVVGSLVVTGALHSLDAFSKEGFSNRYIVSGVYQNFQGSSFDNDPAIIVRAEQLEKEDLVAKKAAAKRLNITFDDKTVDPSTQAIFTDPSGVKHLNTMSKFALQAIAEQEATDSNQLTLEKFKTQVGRADHFYRGMMRDMTRLNQPSTVLIKDGKELYDPNNAGGYGTAYGMTSDKTGLQTMTDEWNLLDSELLQPFVLKGQDLAIGSDGSLPIIASYAAAQEVLKLPALTKNATVQEKKSRLETVRSQIAGKTFEICYRNNSSNTAYQAAIQQQEYIRQNSGKKDYQKPELIYKPSEMPCQAPVVVRDVRTVDTKLYQQHQDDFDRQFGKVDAYSQVLKFRIVGVAQDSPYANGGMQGGVLGLTDILSTVMSSSVGARWVSPMSVRDSSLATKDVFALGPVALYASQEVYFAEYQDAQAARTVLTTKTCRPMFDNPTEASGTSIPPCSRSGTSYVLAPFGSASLAIDDFRSMFRRVQLIAALIVGVIAAVILIGMIGRIIADARKETAVFRATGASRFMVAQIYLAYTLCLVGLMIVIALALGFGVALWVDSQYGPDSSISMALLFNVADLSKQFTFYALEPYDIGVISLAVLGAAFVGAVIPISSNIQRNPIRDMRDE